MDRQRGRRWGLRIGLVAALLSSVGGAGAGLRAHYLPTGYVLPGLLIDGERVQDGRDAANVRAFVQSRAAALAARKVKLAVPGADAPVLEATLGELGLVVDVEQTTLVASRVGKDADPWSRAQITREARAGQIDVPLRVSVDRSIAFPRLEGLKETTDVEAISARLDLDKHATIPEKNGRYIDPDGAVARLEDFARERPATTDRVELPIATFAPRIVAAYLRTSTSRRSSPSTRRPSREAASRNAAARTSTTPRRSSMASSSRPAR